MLGIGKCFRRQRQALVAFVPSHDILPTRFGYPFQIRFPIKSCKTPKSVAAIDIAGRLPAAFGRIAAMTGSVGY